MLVLGTVHCEFEPLTSACPIVFNRSQKQDDAERLLEMMGKKFLTAGVLLVALLSFFRHQVTCSHTVEPAAGKDLYLFG